MYKITVALLSLALVYTWAQSPDDVHAYIGCIIETRLSNDACKAFARAQGAHAPDPAHACSSLEASKSQFLAAGCTEADYNILHAVICERQDLHCGPPPVGK